MWVTLDTNILARALPGRSGPARELVERVSQTPHVIVTSPPLLHELARVLRYPRVRRVHGLDDVTIDQFVQDVEAASLVVPLTVLTVTAICRDPDDNAIIAAAIAGGAEVVCTRDRHFYARDVVDFCLQHGIRIVDDVQLLAELNPSGGSGSIAAPP